MFNIIDKIYKDLLQSIDNYKYDGENSSIRQINIKAFNITVDLESIQRNEIEKDYRLLHSLYNILTDISQFPCIYLASDDSVLIDQIISITPELNVIVNPYSFVLFPNGTVVSNQRYTDNSLLSVIIDMFMLAETGMFIGQDSSRVSRFVLQLYATNHYNFDQLVASVDNYKKEHTIAFPWWMVDQR